MSEDPMHMTVEEESSARCEAKAALCPCPAKWQELIEQASLESLVFWKMNSLLSRFGGELPDNLMEKIQVYVERPLLALVLKHSQGNRTKAAQVLGCNRNTIRRKLEEMEMSVEELILLAQELEEQG